MKVKVMDCADVVIVGAGAAGLITALSLAPKRVVVLSEKPLGNGCASAWSQGGIAAAVGEQDTPSSHATDTLRAAAGTADVEAVRLLTAEAPAAIKALEQLGVHWL
jgi:L-aspartate oxidase